MRKVEIKVYDNKNNVVAKKVAEFKDYPHVIRMAEDYVKEVGALHYDLKILD